MAVKALARLAARSSPETFLVAGRNAQRLAEDLSCDRRIRPAMTPRHASVLLIVGEVPGRDVGPLRQLHDQMAHPRAPPECRSEPDPAFQVALRVPGEADPIDRVLTAHRDLFAGRLASEPDLLPDEPPAPWRGRGDHGQGGEGMMGGKPYGRPMPMTSDDLRDGLALDAYTLCAGPFLPGLPPGLLLEVELQGDVVQSAQVRHPPYEQSPVSRETLLLACIARFVRLLGLGALATRLLTAARAATSREPVDVRSLGRRLRWSRVLAAIPPDLGIVAGPGSDQQTDVRSRIAAWIAELESFDRSASAGTSAVPRCGLSELLTGCEWQEALLVLNSFAPEELSRICRPEDDGRAESA